ncbi:MAG TPA: ABC transporter permease subunit [Bacteroidota bacterium]|nr:ABC transporter permease subunit [Bacteroidota bacterium]
MLTHIMVKEIRDNFLNIRFLGACVVSLLIIAASIAIMARTHEEGLRDYQSGVRTQEEFIDRFAHVNRLSWMSRRHREPPHLQALAGGIDAEAQQENFVSNPLPALFSRMDYVAVVTLIISLFAVLFSYNAVCGEREAGLLRQILAAGVPRRTVLAGKYLGGLASVLIPFTISALAGMLLLALNPGVQLDGTDFAVFGTLLLASWLFVAVFCGIGLFISTVARTSAQAILIALFAWVVLVLVIPNISPFLAAEISPVPSAAKINQQVFQIVDRERDAIIGVKLREMIERSYPDIAPTVGLPGDALQQRLAADLPLKERYARFMQDRDAMMAQVNREQQAKAEKINADFRERSGRQESLARMITSASPVSDFIFVATDLAETGIAAESYWRRQANEYNDALGRIADERQRQARDQNPAFSENDHVDLRNRPQFREAHADLATRIAPDAAQWALLLIFNVLFFLLALAGFQRYDVR